MLHNFPKFPNRVCNGKLNKNFQLIRYSLGIQELAINLSFVSIFEEFVYPNLVSNLFKHYFIIKLIRTNIIKLFMKFLNRLLC